jgi:hypothetical protein
MNVNIIDSKKMLKIIKNYIKNNSLFIKNNSN